MLFSHVLPQPFSQVFLSLCSAGGLEDMETEPEEETTTSYSPYVESDEYHFCPQVTAKAKESHLEERESGK